MLNKNKQCKCKEKISFAGKEGFCAKCCLPVCHQEPPEEECKHEIENNMCEPYCRKCKIPLPPSKCEQWEGEFAENFLDLDELWYKADPKQVKSFISSLLAKQKEEAYFEGKDCGVIEERQRVVKELRERIIWQLKDKKERKYYDELLGQL